MKILRYSMFALFGMCLVIVSACVCSVVVFGAQRNVALLHIIPVSLVSAACASLGIVCEKRACQSVGRHRTTVFPLWIDGIILGMVMVLIGCVVWHYVAAAPDDDRPTENGLFDYFPARVVETNGNNFQNGGRIDYQDGEIGYILNNTLYVTDREKNITVYDDISAPFAFCGNGIIYKADGDLMMRTQSDDEQIAECIDTFSVWNKTVIYSADSNLYMYDTDSTVTQKLSEDVTNYVVYDDYAVVVDGKRNVKQIDLHTTDIEDTGFDMLINEGILQVVRNKLVTLEQNGFTLSDLQTGETQSISFANADVSCDDIAFVCDDHFLWYTYASDSEKTEDKEHGGTWRIDLDTGYQWSFTDVWYDELYLYTVSYGDEMGDEQVLFGVKDGVPGVV